MKTDILFDVSSPGRKGYSLPPLDVPERDLRDLIPPDMLNEADNHLPELSELDVMRHFVLLSNKNFSVDSHFYPLGSCTMKYNPKVNEEIARLRGFAEIHPYTPQEHVQGALELLWMLEKIFVEITGMDRFTLQPAAGAHGELTALLMTRAYFAHKGEKRTTILVPDSAHGTNPASASMSGFKVVQVASNEKGHVDCADLEKHLSGDVACLMMTNPNTLGLFEPDILKIAAMIHQCGGILYYDGANLNATLGIVRPGDVGFDLVHLNPHKTFSTPHGGGGPGAGPVGAKGELMKFLPLPQVRKNEAGGTYFLSYDEPLSIGRVRAFYGNFLVLVRAFAYLMSVGKEGLREISEVAVLNARYLMKALAPYFHFPYPGPCMHEFVASAKDYKTRGVKALDIAKRLLDFGFHAPTVYFPLIVEEALMVEPTETESKKTLDGFVEALKKIHGESRENPEILLKAPHAMPVRRLDDVTAARKPDLRWNPDEHH
ncbi:MAG: aminomethyl-transferring glycine dehydrogenase subunit GcvPB [Candidatus Eremiobacteraeota bacterium]|nr:aminomethyl-transferring glycine dehydrogenase subunit GcvPB [Candidatus Eremiobacteraeota bacterium]